MQTSRLVTAIAGLTALLTVMLLTLSPAFTAESAGSARVAAQTSVYSFAPKDISGRTVPLSNYQGKVLLIVNTASLCGNTPQYASLEKLYQQYKSQGLRILAFPANNFANQEPGNNGQIYEFCTGKYHTTFDLFSKVSVAGPDQAPLYTYLTSKSSDPKFGGPIEWNFAKFLIGRDGSVVNRFPAGHDPLSPDVIAAIRTELAKPGLGSRR